MTKKNIKLSATVKRIGNSYSIRIPMRIIKELKINGGQQLDLEIKKPESDWNENSKNQWLNTARQCKEFKEYSDDKIILLSRLAFNEGKKIMEVPEEKEGKFMNTKWTKAKNLYRKELSAQFGKKIYNEYIYFRSIFEELYKQVSKST